MTFKIGLTGSIGMGKSTTAKLFAEFGCETWDADAVVHRLYSAGGQAVVPISDIFSEAIEAGEISRDALKRIISNDPSALKQIEAIVHPLVFEDRIQFLRQATSDIVVLDIPLLFETGGDKNVDAVVCVTIDPDTQARRVLARGTMDREAFEAIRAKQMPNEEKCARADYVVTTDTIEHARQQVQAILDDIRRNRLA